MAEQTPHPYQDLIEQSPDPIITLDPTGTIRFVNLAAEEVAMLSSEELVGTHFTKTGLLSATGVVKAVQEFALVVMGHTRPPFELEIVRQDQSLVTMEAHPKRLRIGDGMTIQVVFRDVTGRKELEEALRNKTAALEQLTRLMEDRDTRILELQREINAALAGLNRPPKYPL